MDGVGRLGGVQRTSGLCVCVSWLLMGAESWEGPDVWGHSWPREMGASCLSFPLGLIDVSER